MLILSTPLGIMALFLAVVVNKWSLAAIFPGIVDSLDEIYTVVLFQIIALTYALVAFGLLNGKNRFFLVIAFLTFCGNLWGATAIAPHSLEHFFLVYYRHAFFVNCIMTAAALVSLRFVLKPADQTRIFFVNTSVSIVTFALLFLLVELPAMLGFVDYRSILIGAYYGGSGPNNRIDTAHGFFHRPFNEDFEDYSYGDAVVQYNAPMDVLHGGQFISDGDGFRNEGERLSAEVLFFGDSFVAGYKVDQKAMLSEQFAKISGRKVRNFGLTDFSLYNSLSVMLHFLPDYQPDVVVWVMFSGNDFPDRGFDFEDWRSRLSETEMTPSIRERSLWWNATRLLSFWSSRFMRSYTDPDYASNFSADLESKTGEPAGIHFFAFAPPHNNGSQSDLILRADDLVRANGACLLMVYAPVKFEVYAPYMTQRMGSDISSWSQTDAKKKLFDWAAGNDIAFLDLTPALRNAFDLGEDPFFLDDAHWSPIGHRVAAEEVHVDLMKRGWLGQGCR